MPAEAQGLNFSTTPALACCQQGGGTVQMSPPPTTRQLRLPRPPSRLPAATAEVGRQPAPLACAAGVPSQPGGRAAPLVSPVAVLAVPAPPAPRPALGSLGRVASTRDGRALGRHAIQLNAMYIYKSQLTQLVRCRARSRQSQADTPAERASLPRRRWQDS